MILQASRNFFYIMGNIVLFPNAEHLGINSFVVVLYGGKI